MFVVLNEGKYLANIVKVWLSRLRTAQSKPFLSNMSDASSQTQEPQMRGRGRGRSRGGLGKYLRARGRGGRGRPAEFSTRLVLEGEKLEEETEEETAERSRKFSRRELGSNADRYLEPEPEVGSDGKSNHSVSDRVMMHRFFF
jgi:hypothetical protein